MTDNKRLKLMDWIALAPALAECMRASNEFNAAAGLLAGKAFRRGGLDLAKVALGDAAKLLKHAKNELYSTEPS